MQKQRQYTREFKVRAVRLSSEEDVTCVEVAEELDIPVKTLYRWRAEFKDKGSDAFVGRGQTVEDEEEDIEQLRRKVARLEQERDILKKAMSIFAAKE